jgi:branched-chain amino acid transport system ATP-binding protein
VILELRDVSKRFGGVAALTRVGFTVKERAIVGLIGPNGAGKTTVFNLVTGIFKPDAGSITFGDRDLVRLSPARIAEAGIARTFQNIRLFAQLTVIENLRVAGQLHHADDASLERRARDLLERFDLAPHAGRLPGELSYGERRKLEIARALMLEPKLLLLDEPAAGHGTAEADALGERVRALRDDLGIAIVLVEHNMRLVMRACDEIHVIDHGESIAHGPPSKVRDDPRVVAAYLGQEAPS